MTDPPSHTEPLPRSSGKAWTLGLSLVPLLLAGGLALAKVFGEGPADLQTGHHISTVYPAVLAYEYAALPITGAIFLAWVLLVANALGRLRQPQGRRTALVAVGVTSVALLWAGLSTLPQLFVGYTHLTGVTTGPHNYHLGIRTALDGDFFFVVSQCPHGQFRCIAYGVTSVDQDERSDLSKVRLTIGKTAQALVIETASRTIPFTLPAP
jgi:hypothetical protein